MTWKFLVMINIAEVNTKNQIINHEKHNHHFSNRLFFLLFSTNCSNEENIEKASATYFSVNKDSLKRLINLSAYHPINVMWKVEPLLEMESLAIKGAENKSYKLEAYIQFDRQTADKLLINHLLKNNLILVSVDSYWFKWLPQKSLLIKDLYKEAPFYEGNIFSKSPFLNGTYIFVSPNTILLRLLTLEKMD